MLLFAKVLWKTERNRIEAVRPYLVKSLSELRLLSGGVWKTRLEPVIIGSSRRSYRGPCPKELWCTRGARDFRPSAEFSQPPVEHVSFRSWRLYLVRGDRISRHQSTDSPRGRFRCVRYAYGTTNRPAQE